MKQNFKKPFVLNMPRVWRTYLGGSMIDALHGAENGADEHFPEEWIMSVISAINAGREHIKNEGLAMIEGEDIPLKSLIDASPEEMLGKEHTNTYGTHPGVLVKILDSSERLAIQVHPNREKAMELFGSQYGKTECWHILGGRSIDGQKPCVYLGFKEGITKEKWKEIFDKQDIPAMLDCLHRFDVEPGDTILIQGGVPHAIGAGCFLVEIQEPTDLTIRTERTTPGGFKIADSGCHQGIGFDRMFDCFEYVGISREETKKRWFLTSENVLLEDGASVTKLVDGKDTSYFAMREIKVDKSLKLKNNTFCGLYVLAGSGTLKADSEKIPLSAPQQIFVPASTEYLEFEAEKGLRILQFFGPTP